MKKYLLVLLLSISLSCQSEKNGNIETNNNDIPSVLSNDSDGDGITDDLDQDNNTRAGVPVDDNGVMQNPIYLDENSVTIKAFEWSIIGDNGIFNKKIYTVVDEQTLRNMVSSDEDVTRVCTSKVTIMTQLFDNKKTFNQDISTWDTSNVNGMNFMFNMADAFNQNISSWNTSNVQDMNYMFRDALSFNQNIRFWDTSNVSIMRDMFNGAVAFNQDLSSWNVLKVYDCQSVFGNTPNWTLQKPAFSNCTP